VISGTSVTVSAALGAVGIRITVSGVAATYSSASGSVYALLILDGRSNTQSRADAWIGLPFQAGALPDEVTAIVWVSNELDAELSVNVLSSSVVADSVGADVEIDTAVTTIETNEIYAEVT
jgi:hypothetical protein